MLAVKRDCLCLRLVPVIPLRCDKYMMALEEARVMHRYTMHLLSSKTKRETHELTSPMFKV